MDTKGEEISYIRECLRACGTKVQTVDVGSQSPPTTKPDITRAEVTGQASFICENTDRGRAVTAMAHALTTYLLKEYEADRIAGVIGIGGSGGTALITAA